jgi:hypothetical protein
MSRLVSALGKAAAFTAKGAAITFGSTMFSCVAACYIELGANQMIYRFFPHKFAHVEAASGITQEQLDAVRIYYAAEIALPDVIMKTSSTQEEEESHALTPVFLSSMNESEDYRTKDYSTTKKESTSSHDEINSKTILWIEQREERTVNILSSFLPIDLPRQEILACAMTC